MPPASPPLNPPRDTTTRILLQVDNPNESFSESVSLCLSELEFHAPYLKTDDNASAKETNDAKRSEARERGGEMETLDETSSLLLPSPTQSRIPFSSSSPPPPPPTCPSLDLFTATELAAAEQLVQLSESSGDSAFWTLSSSSFSSYSSSPRSVNTRPAPAVMIAEDDEDEDEIAGAPRRRRRRIRLIDDVYKATAPIALAATRGGMESSVGGRGGRAGRSKCRRKFGTGF